MIYVFVVLTYIELKLYKYMREGQVSAKVMAYVIIYLFVFFTALSPRGEYRC